jgi:hypothetical protein
VAKHVPYGDPLCPPIAPDVRGEVARERRVQRQTICVHELGTIEGEDRLTQVGCVEDCMLVDRALRPVESNALTPIAIEPTLTYSCKGDPGHVAEGGEAAKQGAVKLILLSLDLPTGG